MIVCAAGDPGGSRVLLPIIKELVQAGEKVVVVNHGFLGHELPINMAYTLCTKKEAIPLLNQSKALLWGSSTNDYYPLSLARHAKAKGILVMHVLDNWSSYRSRLCTDGLEPCMPDIYTVIDEESRLCALSEGIPASSITIVGHPAMEDLADFANKLSTSQRKSLAPAHGSPPNKTCIAFICEPFSQVFGEDCQKAGHPGFTEEIVLKHFAFAMTPYAENAFVFILPHPKHNPHAMQHMWDHYAEGLQGKVITPKQGRSVLKMVSGVAGMASILLYEACICGLPVLSLQPSCRSAAMQRFAHLQGCEYTDVATNIPAKVGMWFEQCRALRYPTPHEDIYLHQHAPMRAANILLKGIMVNK